MNRTQVSQANTKTTQVARVARQDSVQCTQSGTSSHVASEYDDYFISGIRFLGKGKYVMIKDNSEWDLDYDYETKDYKKKAFIEETEILEKNLDKDIFEEDNSFNL